MASPDETLYLDEDELAKEEQEDDSLECDPIQALRLRGDFDDEYRDSADFANERAKSKKRVRERRNVRYSCRQSKELPDWLGDPAKLPKKPPTKKGT